MRQVIVGVFQTGGVFESQVFPAPIQAVDQVESDLLLAPVGDDIKFLPQSGQERGRQAMGVGGGNDRQTEHGQAQGVKHAHDDIDVVARANQAPIRNIQEGALTGRGKIAVSIRGQRGSGPQHESEELVVRSIHRQGEPAVPPAQAIGLEAEIDAALGQVFALGRMAQQIVVRFFGNPLRVLPGRGAAWRQLQEPVPVARNSVGNLSQGNLPGVIAAGGRQTGGPVAVNEERRIGRAAVVKRAHGRKVSAVPLDRGHLFG